MKRFLYKCSLFLVCFVIIERFCHKQTAGFRTNKIVTDFDYKFPARNLSVPKDLLNQPFYFLGSGVQSYAFIGKDQKTVLKLFKHHHFGLSTYALSKLPFNLGSSLLKNRVRKMHHLFESAKIASEQLREETGVLYSHLKGGGNLGSITLYDKLHIAHPLDLNKAEFVLQKKVEPASYRLHALLQKNELDKALEAMENLIQLVARCSEKGVKNRDGKITENYGFIGGSAVELDIGSYHIRSVSDHPNPHKKATFRARLQLLSWIKQNYPETLPYLKDKLLHETID